MTKRVQITLSDEEYEALAELSELRGESMSRVLGEELVGLDSLRAWRQETAARQIAAQKFEAVERQLEARVSKLRS
jgi:hypothetical protein